MTYISKMSSRWTPTPSMFLHLSLLLHHNTPWTGTDWAILTHVEKYNNGCFKKKLGTLGKLINKITQQPTVPSF